MTACSSDLSDGNGIASLGINWANGVNELGPLISNNNDNNPAPVWRG